MKRSIVSPGFVKRTLAKLLKLDQQLGIVVDGNVASQAIAVGKYVNLINSTITGKQDGIYVATGAVSSGGTVTATDISGDAIADGVTNDLSEHLATVFKFLTNVGASDKTATGATAVSVATFNNQFYVNHDASVLFNVYGDIKVNGYTGYLDVYCDGTRVCRCSAVNTAYQQIMGCAVANVSKGTHTLEIKIEQQQAGQTVSLQAWTEVVVFGVVA